MVAAAALLGLLLVLGLSISRLDTELRDGIADGTRKTTEVAFSIMEYYHAQERSGAMSRTAAQQAAMDSIGGLRYADDNYFWINDMHPRMIMHPFKPELNGTDISQNADPNGVRLFSEMVEVVEANGEGFVDYSWPRPGAEEPQPKISFVKGFAPWGWIVGTGVYVDDIEATVNDAAMSEGMMVAAVIALVALLAFLLGRSITKPLKRITKRMRRLASGDTASEIPDRRRRDEVGEMAAALEVFREGVLAKEKAEAAKARADSNQEFVVTTLSEKLARLADGDLTANIVEVFPEGYADLKKNYNDAVIKLCDLMMVISESAAAIRTGSEEIAHASEDLARRTEANAATLEQTSASLGEMEHRLNSTAQASTHTAEETSSAVEVVGNGRTTANEAVLAMGRVSDSAEGIDTVIEGLDKIAFQTRVLAMNAAVEAGRAGEAGRGFAVVADLVSALAMRAEEESKHARGLLTTTQTDVQGAVQAVERVDGALAGIADSISKVHELVATIAGDNQAQSRTISEISGAVSTMDKSTQQNAAMVEETSAAARNLAGEVTHLADSASRFQVSGKAPRLPSPVTESSAGPAELQKAAA